MTACPKCGTELVAVQKKNQVSAGGIIGVLVFLLALPMLLFNLLLGAVLMILALLIGTVGRGTHIEMYCPKCKKAVNL